MKKLLSIPCLDDINDVLLNQNIRMSLKLRYLRRNVRYVYLRLISRKSDVASIMRISMMNKTAFTPLFIYNIANLDKTDNNCYFFC